MRDARTNVMRPTLTRRGLFAVGTAALVSCAGGRRSNSDIAGGVAGPLPGEELRILANRATWGIHARAAHEVEAAGWEAFVESQLQPAAEALPSQVADHIASLSISNRTALDLLRDNELARQRTMSQPEGPLRSAEVSKQRAEQERVADEAVSRHLLRAVHSSNQVLEQMIWFWTNHFNVWRGKGTVRLLLADYEEGAIRPHALGRFRDLLGAAIRHPAMLVYLDNTLNAAGRINENLARELMELHTLGVDGGYTQVDVQELARVLTGFGISLSDGAPTLPPGLAGQYVRSGAMEFNPARHDQRPKTFLGQRLGKVGPAELDEVLDRLATHPATATFISRKLAQWWVADEPPAEMVEAMADAYVRSDGHIGSTLRIMFGSRAFLNGRKLKDPVRYVLSVLRLGASTGILQDTAAPRRWLQALGQPLYGKQTPDGYATETTAWNSPSQLGARLAVAGQMASRWDQLFGAGARPNPDAAALLNLSDNTRTTLAQARSSVQGRALLFATPEMMYR